MGAPQGHLPKERLSLQRGGAEESPAQGVVLEGAGVPGPPPAEGHSVLFHLFLPVRGQGHDPLSAQGALASASGHRAVPKGG